MVDLGGYIIVLINHSGKMKLYGSPADSAENLEIGDEILEVNGRTLENASHSEILGHIHECIKSRTICLRVRRRSGNKMNSSRPWENPDFWDQPNNFACPCGRRFDEGLRYLLHMVNSYHDRTITPRQYANMVRAYSDNEIRNAPADDLRSIAESRQPRKTKEARVSGWIATGDTELKVRRDPEASTYSSRRPRATRNVKGKLVTIDEDRRTESEETTPSVSEPPRNDDLRAQITVEASTTTSSRRRPVPQKIQQPATTTRPKDDERVEEAARASMLPLRRRIILRFIGPRRDVVQHVSSSDNRGTVAQGTASTSAASTSSTTRRDDESDSTGLPVPKEPSDE